MRGFYSKVVGLLVNHGRRARCGPAEHAQNISMMACDLRNEVQRVC